jgi:hypothetical protein
MAKQNDNEWKDIPGGYPVPEGDTWQQMHNMLDKHMPQEKKDVKRYVYFTLLLLLLVTGICNCPGVMNRQQGVNKSTDTKDALAGKMGKNESKATNEATRSQKEKSTEIIKTGTNYTNTQKPVLLVQEKQGRHDGDKATKRSNSISKSPDTAQGFALSQRAVKKNSYKKNTSQSNSLPAARHSSEVVTKPSVVTDTTSQLLQKKGVDTLRHAVQKDSTRQDSLTVKETIVQKNDTKKKVKFSIGLGVNGVLAIGRQQQSLMTPGAGFSDWGNFTPVLSLKYFLKENMYLQAEVQAYAPQFTPVLLLEKKAAPWTGPVVTGASSRLESNVFLKKLFYLDVPVSFHISPLKKTFVGAGVQYSYLLRATGVYEERKVTTGRPDSLISYQTKAIEQTLSNRFLKTSDWRYFINASVRINRIDIGARYTRGFASFMRDAGVSPGTRQTNASFLFYIRYELLQLK